MAEIRITQLCAAPDDLWRFHAITDSDAAGDAIIYISRVLAFGLAEHGHDQGDVAAARVAAIDADGLQGGLADEDCVGSGSGWSTDVVRAPSLEEALTLAEQWWRQVFRRVLAGHDIAPSFHRSGMNSWQLHAGPCASNCPRCTVERVGEIRLESPVVIDEFRLRALNLQQLVALLDRQGVAVPDTVDARNTTAIVDWLCSEYGGEEAEE